MMARVYTRLPIFVEASARVMQKKGLEVLSEWGRIMTGADPKMKFLKPRMVLPILFEAAKLLIQIEPHPGGLIRRIGPQRL